MKGIERGSQVGFELLLLEKTHWSCYDVVMQRFMFATCISFALLGCQKAKPTLVGTWTNSIAVLGMPSVSDSKFLDGGKYVEVTVTTGPKGKIIIHSAGTWKLIGNSLYVILTESKWRVDGMADAAKAKEMNKKLAAQSNELMLITNDMFPVEIRWDTDDQISFDLRGKAYT